LFNSNLGALSFPFLHFPLPPLPLPFPSSSPAQPLPLPRCGPQIQLGGLGERCKLPQRGLGRPENPSSGGNNFNDFPKRSCLKFSVSPLLGGARTDRRTDEWVTLALYCCFYCRLSLYLWLLH